jgi:hypothetical protein
MIEARAQEHGRQFPYFMKISSRELDLFVINGPGASGSAAMWPLDDNVGKLSPKPARVPT